MAEETTGLKLEVEAVEEHHDVVEYVETAYDAGCVVMDCHVEKDDKLSVLNMDVFQHRQASGPYVCFELEETDLAGLSGLATKEAPHFSPHNDLQPTPPCPHTCVIR